MKCQVFACVSVSFQIGKIRHLLSVADVTFCNVSQNFTLSQLRELYLYSTPLSLVQKPSHSTI